MCNHNVPSSSPARVRDSFSFPYFLSALCILSNKKGIKLPKILEKLFLIIIYAVQRKRLYWNNSCKTQFLNGTLSNCFIFSLWQLFTTYSKLFHRKKWYVYKLNLQLHSKDISGNVKALDHQKRPQIEFFHSFGSLVSRAYQHKKHKMNVWYGSKDRNEDGR